MPTVFVFPSILFILIIYLLFLQFVFHFDFVSDDSINEVASRGEDLR